jgi:hypothetical protein
MCCWRCGPSVRGTRRLYRGAGDQPKLDTLLPLVALGTVADVVKLDANNRRLVAQGLRRMRAGALPCGLASLFTAAGARPQCRHHLRFRLCAGPAHQCRRPPERHDAGHRVPADRRCGRADELARTLDGINRERRDIEGGMREQAMQMAQTRCSTKARSRRQPSACSTPISTKAWSASWPRASRTSCTAPPSCSPPAARRARSTNSRARAGRSRLSPARRAGPGGQAPPRRAAAIWRPRHGGRLHHRRGKLRHLRAGAATRSRTNGWTRHADQRRWTPTARWRPNTAAPTWSTRCTRRSGARALRRRPSARRWRWFRSAWSAKNTWRSNSSTRASRSMASGSATPSPCPPGCKLAFRLDADEWQRRAPGAVSGRGRSGTLTRQSIRSSKY